MYDDKRRAQIVLIIMLAILCVMTLGMGAPDAIKEYKRAKECSVALTAVKDPSKSVYWSESHGGYRGGGNVHYMEHTFVYSYDGKDYDLQKVMVDYELAPSADEVKILIDPDRPENYVFEDDSDVDNVYIKSGGLALFALLVIGVLFKIGNKDYV